MVGGLAHILTKGGLLQSKGGLAYGNMVRTISVYISAYSACYFSFTFY